ncbi:NAD-dependent epimerase/dehydratase family protein [Stutzerimonas stutzeri]|uniref:NAD-dependent epimerase/dehydratase family protein n=1 Tax=Stutzerimonas stutzeri TaxID=316 RepID=UPI00210E2076|nr:NAD-dependent epimerase/dehydratase family protein [Stutzerimonas stutzeri]MCQ4321571.1 NAD-dependent epimerase/dehydratase family protein [Stutzerimonas stutzeri]
MTDSKVALVVGASGILGHARVETLVEDGSCNVRTMRRTFVPDVETLNLDLTDAAATREALATAGAIIHVFYAALRPDQDLGRGAEINVGVAEPLPVLRSGNRREWLMPATHRRAPRPAAGGVRQAGGLALRRLHLQHRIRYGLGMGKIRRAGFTEALSTGDCLIGAPRRLGEKGYTPNFSDNNQS